jgi:hypothetical protein
MGEFSILVKKDAKIGIIVCLFNQAQRMKHAEMERQKWSYGAT